MTSTINCTANSEECKTLSVLPKNELEGRKLFAVYANKLAEQLNQNTEMIVDLSCLQMCLDPQQERTPPVIHQEGEEDIKFNYESFLFKYFTTPGSLPKLESFKLRAYNNLDFPLTDGIKQLYALTELDLAGNTLSPSTQESLQFWSLSKLKMLKLDKTSLSQLPPSVGKLKALEELSLSDNKLSDLPITLGFCTKLKILNLKNNSFTIIPGVVLQLQSLTDLKRHGNNILQLFNGFEGLPHISSKQVKSTSAGPWNPDDLQSLSARALMTNHIDYWENKLLPPLQCKIMDTLASKYKYCEHCHKPVSAQAYDVDVMILRYLGLTHVPFRLHACSAECKAKIIEEYSRKQHELYEQMDDEYEQQKRAAILLVERENVDISSETINAPGHQVEHFVAPGFRASDWGRRSRTKRCTIM